MFKYMAQVREAWHKGSLVKAQTLEAHNRAHFTGQVIPKGSAFVRPAGLKTEIDQPNFSERNYSETIQPVRPTPDIDIVTECLALGRAYALLAGQQLGKTYVARHIAAKWDREGREIWFIGPKWGAGEWGANVTMWGPDWPEIAAGLVAVAAEAKTRREQAIRDGLKTQDCPPRLVVIDDWTECAQMLGQDAQRFVVSATTMFASVNLIPLFCGHADTSAAWGTDRVGKSLTENFLRIRVHRAQDGARQYGVLYPAEVERRQEGKLVYPQHGFIPAGEPTWAPLDVHTHTAYPPPERDSEGVAKRDAPGMRYAIAAASPRRVRIKTERGWRNYTVPLKTATNARRLYEETGTITAVASKLKLTGSKQVKTALAKAMLNIPSPNYTILEA